MPPRGVKKGTKRARQYEHIKDSLLDRGSSEDTAEEIAVQGCWLDWEKIESRLREEVADLLPEFELRPIPDEAEAPPSRGLATLPVQLVAPLPAGVERGWSPMMLSLLAAWSCLGAAMLAAAALLWGVVALSERLAAFGDARDDARAELARLMQPPDVPLDAQRNGLPVDPAGASTPSANGSPLFRNE